MEGRGGGIPLKVSDFGRAVLATEVSRVGSCAVRRFAGAEYAGRRALLKATGWARR